MLEARCWMRSGWNRILNLVIQNPEFRIQNPEPKTILLPLILILLSACSGNHSESIKFQQYYVQGEQLYKKNCSNCHQADGSGLGLLYPPLNQSDYMKNNFEHVLCLMKHGVRDSVTVNGKVYIQPMPGIPTLTDLEIAEIATYIYNTWEHDRGIVEVAEVTRLLKGCNAE